MKSNIRLTREEALEIFKIFDEYCSEYNCLKTGSLRCDECFVRSLSERGIIKDQTTCDYVDPRDRMTSLPDDRVTLLPVSVGIAIGLIILYLIILTITF